MEEQAKYISKKQLSLFDDDPEPVKLCSVCKENPKSRNGKKILWNGFRDMDLNVLVCFKADCVQQHYLRKKETEYKNLFSEFPEPYSF